MRVNVYNEELTDEVEVSQVIIGETGRRFIGLRFVLESSPKLHHTPEDDDRSSVTLWTGSHAETRDLLARALAAIDADDEAKPHLELEQVAEGPIRRS